MQLKTFSRRTLLIIIFVELAAILAFVLFVYFTPKNSADSNAATPTQAAVAPPAEEKPGFGLPLRLKIPSISVDAPVESVGLTSAGAMDVPKNPDGVAWFNLGSHPGNSGSAVIAGHNGIWDTGKDTVFKNLNKLQKGDKLYVVDDKGATIAFVVRENRTYDPNADASAVFSSNDSKPYLNLVTCESWNKITESYSMRLVVFADKVD